MKLAPSNPDNLLRSPNQPVAVGEAPSSALSWTDDSLYANDLNNVAPSVGMVWDPSGDGKNVLRGNYRMAFDRINTFVISSTILQSIPGITAAQTNTAYGQAGGRLPGLNVGSLQPTFSPESFLTPPAVSTNSMTVLDKDFETPTTHAWAISYQREVWSRTVVEVAYIGRRGQQPVRRLQRQPGRDLQERLPRRVQHRQGGRPEPAHEPVARRPTRGCRPARPAPTWCGACSRPT